jgi:Na+-driven multidrug efflux pump
MFGKRFLDAPHRFLSLTLRLALLGAAIGFATTLGMAGGGVWLFRAFTRDEQMIDVQRVAWPLLCFSQPLNPYKYGYYAIAYAGKGFRCARGKVPQEVK